MKERKRRKKKGRKAAVGVHVKQGRNEGIKRDAGPFCFFNKSNIYILLIIIICFKWLNPENLINK